MTDGFNIDYEDEPEYEYHDEETSTSVKVKVRDFSNGATVGVHHYDSSGEKLEYYRFQINSVEHNRLVLPNVNEGGTLPDPVTRALHAGGWEIMNVERTNIAPMDDDPFEVQMLDVRDGFYAAAESSSTAYQEHLYESMARATEIALFSHGTHAIAEQEGRDPEVVHNEMVEKAMDTRQSVDFDIKDEVEGSLINAVRPETQRSTEQQDHMIDVLEDARSLYRANEDITFDEAMRIRTDSNPE